MKNKDPDRQKHTWNTNTKDLIFNQFKLKCWSSRCREPIRFTRTIDEPSSTSITSLSHTSSPATRPPYAVLGGIPIVGFVATSPVVLTSSRSTPRLQWSPRHLWRHTKLCEIATHHRRAPSPWPGLPVSFGRLSHLHHLEVPFWIQQ